MPDAQGPEVLYRPPPRFSDRQLFIILFVVVFFLVSVLLLLAKIPRGNEPAETQGEIVQLTLEEAAQRYGYKIHYKQQGDTTGRTVITRERGGFDLWGTSSRPGEEEAITHLWGQVGEIEEVSGSDDLLVSIINPVENEEIARIRIDRTKPNLPGGTNLEIFTTPLFLDSLAGPFEPEKIGYAGQWSEEDFKKLLREGDFLGAGIALTWEDPLAKTGKLVPSRDEFGNLLLTGITIRRVGSKEVLLNDLLN